MATEKRLIDANALVAHFRRTKIIEVFPNWANLGARVHAAVIRLAVKYREIILSAPTVDAVEVVRGHWEKTIDNCTVMHKCSVCGARVVKGFYEHENPNRYCYHCGAKMDGDKDSYGHNADKCDTVTYKGAVLLEPPKMEGW